MNVIHYGNTDLTVSDLLQGDVKLSSPPEIYARLRKLIDEPDSTTNMLAEIIEQDPALSTRLLKLANSAFFALPQEVISIPEAVSIIGFRDIQDLVLATEVIQRFDSIPEDLVDIYSYWRHSLRCAVLSRQLATTLPTQHASESMFLAGLLHGIGHLVIYTRIPELGRKALLEHRHRGIPLQEAEHEVMGFDYAQVGAALAAQWKLPPLLRSVLAHHLHPDKAEEFRLECALVGLAHTLSEAGSFEESTIDALLAPNNTLLQAAGIEGDQLKAILPEAENAFGAALALLH
ncbi:MAG: HDOD domain-containing protein [Candidatus Thiodiazotropha sp.]